MESEPIASIIIVDRKGRRSSGRPWYFLHKGYQDKGDCIEYLGSDTVYVGCGLTSGAESISFGGRRASLHSGTGGKFELPKEVREEGVTIRGHPSEGLRGITAVSYGIAPGRVDGFSNGDLARFLYAPNDLKRIEKAKKD